MTRKLQDMTLEELKPYVTEYYRRVRTQQAPPRGKVTSECKHCGKPFGARELRTHQPQCRKAHAAPDWATGPAGEFDLSKAGRGIGE